MMLDLNSWEAKLLLEAVRTLDAQWNAIIDNTEDEDIQSDYGNDLAQLQLMYQRVEAEACEAFGPWVKTFSREPVGVTPTR